jgi:hypothetical protein
MKELPRDPAIPSYATARGGAASGALGAGEDGDSRPSGRPAAGTAAGGFDLAATCLGTVCHQVSSAAFCLAVAAQFPCPLAPAPSHQDPDPGPRPGANGPFTAGLGARCARVDPAGAGTGAHAALAAGRELGSRSLCVQSPRLAAKAGVLEMAGPAMTLQF